jgi:hypothetical protein
MTDLVIRLRASSKLFSPEQHEAASEIEELRGQRDGLLAALHIAKNGLVQWHVPENRYAALDVINAAIASVKGEKGC